MEVDGLTGSFTVTATPVPFWMRPGYVAGILIVIITTAAIIYVSLRQVVTEEVRSW